MAKISVVNMTALFQQMYQEKWKYVHGKHEKGTVDCIGAFIYAYSYYGKKLSVSGTNDLARSSNIYGMKTLQSSTKLVPGMIVLRSRASGSSSYALPDKYKPGGSKANGDYTDYYHIGLIGSDLKLYHASSETTGFVKSEVLSTSKGIVSYVAYLSEVDYGNTVSSATTSSNAIVFSSSPLADTYQVTSNFGTRASGDHKGIDLDVVGAADGTVAVLAVMSGKVTVSTYSTSYGNYVELDHGDGVKTRYAHLDSLSVSVGESVNAGTRLGMMGNTGNSTGTHLHLELLINNTAVDPARYLTSIGSSTGTGSTLSTSASSTTQTLVASTVLYATDRTVGRRSIDNTGAQPAIPYINIYIGESELLTTDPPRPNIIQRLEFNRLVDAGSTATIVVFDDNWDRLEKIFANNWYQIGLEFGYKNSTLRSPRYNMILSTYSIAFNNTGVVLSIQAISTSAYYNLNPVSVETGSYNPTEAIKMICQAQGWTIDSTNFVSTKDVARENPYNLVSEYPIQYIIQEIVKEAVTEDGELVYFHLDESTNVATLTPKILSSDAVKTYVYQKGYDSVVQSLSFNIKGIFAAGGFLDVATNMTVNNINNQGEEVTSNVDISSTITSTTGTYMHTSNNQSSVRVDGAGDTQEQSSVKLYYSLKNSLNHAYEATMTILGDPTIKLLDVVRIINLTDSGQLHHTSGIYLVQKVSHSISGGSFLTTLQLIHNADINEGIELINPKSLIK